MLRAGREHHARTKAKDTHTLRSAFDEMMEVSDAKDSTKELYRGYFKSVASVIPETTLVTHITPLMVKRFLKKRGEELKPCTLQGHLTLLSQILRYCQRNGYTEFRISPTDGCRQGIVAVRQSWLTPDQVRTIRDMETRTRGWRRFQDYFMLSYYLGGINIIDLARINFNECADTIHYVRTKTERKQKVNPFVEFKIPDVAKPIIEKYKQPDGHLFISNSPDHCQYFIKPSHKIREKFGFKDLTFYSARKSFAQHAFALGISESVIDYVLGHSLGGGRSKVLYSYIKVTPDMATDAVRKVCEFIASTRNF